MQEPLPSPCGIGVGLLHPVGERKYYGTVREGGRYILLIKYDKIE